MITINRINISAEKPQSPGSFNEFCKGNNVSAEQAIGCYAIALDEYRSALAEYYEVSPEDLHAGPFNYEQPAKQ